MSVGKILVLCMAIISALASLLAARTVVDAWSNYAASSEGIATTQSLAAALRTIERLGVERAPAQPLLVAQDPADGAALKPLLDVRAAVDQSIAELRGAAASLAGSPAAIVGPSSDFTTALIAVRKAVDAAVALPKEKRDPNIGVDMLVKIGTLQKALTPLIDSLQGEAARANYRAGAFVGLARLVANLRDVSGRLNSGLVGVLGAGQKLTPQERRIDEHLHGQIDQLLLQVTAAIEQLGRPPLIVGKLKAMDEAFVKRARGASDAIFLAVTDGPPLDKPTLEYTKLTSSGNNDVIAVRDAALDQAIETTTQSRDAALRELAVASAVLLLVIGVAAASILYIRRRLVSPLVTMTRLVGELAAGGRDIEVPFVQRSDEIGGMAKAVLTFRDGLAAADRLRAEQDRAGEAAEARRVALSGLIDSFTADANRSVEALRRSADAMRAGSAELGAAAGQTHESTNTVASAAGQVTTNVTTVSTAAEQLAAAIAEIGRQVNTAADRSRSAVSEAGNTEAVVTGLSAAVERIGQVLHLIEDIASQTNLLALNATIEAARAGDAGKGFAVVASEVKLLAGQTAKATDEIQTQIAAIQAETRRAAEAINAMRATIQGIDEINSAIAAAVEEQGAATGEIARHVGEAASGTREVSTIIASVQADAGRTRGAVGGIESAAGEVAERAGEVETAVSDFVRAVAAA
jgi:methyl-accepting chemotaxis protein